MNLFIFVGNTPISSVDKFGLNRRNCQSISKEHQIQLSSAELLQQGFSVFNATARGTVDIEISGEKCEECCNGIWKEIQEISFSLNLSATVNATLGGEFQIWNSLRKREWVGRLTRRSIFFRWGKH